MNWNAFFGAVTWCDTALTLLSAVIFVSMSVAAWEDGKCPKTWVIVCASLSVVAFIVNIAIIVGMGWYPK